MRISRCLSSTEDIPVIDNYKCNGERSFSRLKRVKSELRSTLLHDGVSYLSLMYIESELLKMLMALLWLCFKESTKVPIV